MVYGIITCIYILNKNSSYLSTLNFDVYGKCIDYIAYMNPMGIAWPWFNKLINLTSLSRAQPRMELWEPGITEIRWSPSPKKRAQGGPIPLLHGGTWGPYTWGNWCSFTPIPVSSGGPTWWFEKPSRLLRVDLESWFAPLPNQPRILRIYLWDTVHSSYRLKGKTKMTMENKPLKIRCISYWK